MIKPTEKNMTPYQEGYVAYCDGVDNNPYTMQSQQAMAWDDGWYTAKDEYDMSIAQWAKDHT